MVDATQKLREFDLARDRNAYPSGPMAEGRGVYRVIGWEGADRGGLLLSEAEAGAIRSTFHSSADRLEALERKNAEQKDNLTFWKGVAASNAEWADKERVAREAAERRNAELEAALKRMVALYESEYDADAFVRPDWLRASLAGSGGEWPVPEVARPLDEWHEDCGDVVWWTWRDGQWLGEPAYIGTPLDLGRTVLVTVDGQEMTCEIGGWPGYHTHWTPHPTFPAAPEAIRSLLKEPEGNA